MRLHFMAHRNDLTKLLRSHVLRTNIGPSGGYKENGAAPVFLQDRNGMLIMRRASVIKRQKRGAGACGGHRQSQEVNMCFEPLVTEAIQIRTVAGYDFVVAQYHGRSPFMLRSGRPKPQDFPVAVEFWPWSEAGPSSTRSNSQASSLFSNVAMRWRTCWFGSRKPFTILLSMVSSIPRFLASLFWRIPLLHSCSFRFGYMMVASPGCDARNFGSERESQRSIISRCFPQDEKF